MEVSRGAYHSAHTILRRETHIVLDRDADDPFVSLDGRLSQFGGRIVRQTCTYQITSDVFARSPDQGFGAGRCRSVSCWLVPPSSCADHLNHRLKLRAEISADLRTPHREEPGLDDRSAVSRPRLPGLESFRLRFHEGGQLLVAVAARVERRVQLPKVAPDRAGTPTRLPAWPSRPRAPPCRSILRRR